MVKLALVTCAFDELTFGVTLIGILLPGVKVPLPGDMESNVFEYPLIAQLSAALPGLDRVNACCAGLLPWIALNVSTLVEIAIAGKGVKPTVGIEVGLGVTVAVRLVTLIVTFSLLEKPVLC